jgi:HlyD family secretion protein/macrolide-specific efflux system membrane fusion protein
MAAIKEYLLRFKGWLDKIVSNKKLFFTIIGVLLIFVLLDVNKIQKSRVPIKVDTVKTGDIVPTVSATGFVKVTQSKLGVRIPGVVKEILAIEGQKVSKGDLLLKLDSYQNAYNEYHRVKKLYNKGFATSQQLENARFNLDGASIKSPIDGTVSNVAVDEGEAATPGVPIITVINPKDLTIEIQIDQADIGQVKKGADVMVNADAYPEEVFNGKLEFLNTEAEQKMVGGMPSTDEEDKIFRGRIKLNNETTKLFSNMSVDAEIVVERMSDILIVPREAVASENEKFYVYVVKWGHVDKKQIKVGLKDNNNVEVSDGIVPGTVVAVSNIIKLKNGTRIKIERK